MTYPHFDFDCFFLGPAPREGSELIHAYIAVIQAGVGGHRYSRYCLQVAFVIHQALTRQIIEQRKIQISLLTTVMRWTMPVGRLLVV